MATGWGANTNANLINKQIQRAMSMIANKNQTAAWFVSNCGTSSKRENYVHRMSKYINIDIYGACGNKKCSRGENDKCEEHLQNSYWYNVVLFLS
jgi:glycoprotein 3-alpha-L-fucosyltransferase